MSYINELYMQQLGLKDEVQRPKIKPFLKWVGGKQRLINDIIKYVPDEFENYYEPFLGAGSMFLKLLELGRLDNSISILCDFNSSLCNVWELFCYDNSIQAILHNLMMFERLHSEDFFHAIKNKELSNSFQEAAKFIYLNKAGFNGLYRENKKGEFNVPFGKRDNISLGIDNIFAVIKSIRDLTGEIVIDDSSFLTEGANCEINSFVYLDPPYYPVSKTSNFTSYVNGSWSQNDHETFVEMAKQITIGYGNKVMISNSDTEFIRKAFRDWNIVGLETNRSVAADGGARKKIKELLIMNY